MYKFALPAVMILATSLIPAGPSLAQGQGGYSPGCAGAQTARMSPEERARARAAHQTNDTNGGRSSIDKSCKTWENGGTVAGPQPGAIDWGTGGARTRFPNQS